jgi:hypothetical protein
MSSASTVGLPYDNIIVLNFETPVVIQSGINFAFTFLENIPIQSGNYIASLYINVVQEGGDTGLGTITTQILSANITNTFPFSSNYLGETSFIDMEGIDFKIQNTQVITVDAAVPMALIGNIFFENTPPSATGILILKAI